MRLPEKYKKALSTFFFLFLWIFFYCLVVSYIYRINFGHFTPFSSCPRTLYLNKSTAYLHVFLCATHRVSFLSMGQGLFTGAGAALMKNLRHQPGTAYGPSRRDGASGAPPPFLADCRQASSYIDLGQVTTTTVNSWLQQQCHIQKISFFFCTSYDSDILSAPCFTMFSEIYKGDRAVPFRANHSIITYSQHFGQVQVSALTTARCSKKLLPWRLDTAH